MRQSTFHAAVIFSALALACPCRAHAQEWGRPMTYNEARAYHHFLTSPYRYRTLYSSTPGYTETTVTPFGYQSSYTAPGYTEQRITPHGYEGYYLVPPQSGYSVTPFSYSSYYAPAYRYGFYAPPMWP